MVSSQAVSAGVGPKMASNGGAASDDEGHRRGHFGSTRESRDGRSRIEDLRRRKKMAEGGRE